MRKLSYEIFNRDGQKIKEVSTYNEMVKETEKGNYVKCKLTEIVERWVYEVYNGKELVKTVTLGKDRAQAKKDGYTVKAVLRAF